MGLFNRRKTGSHYEQLAANYLSRQGLTLIEKNFTIRGGEIDLIMQDGLSQTLVFVEVKYRQNQRHGHAAETVTRSKQRHLIRTATLWMKKQHLNIDATDFRFDVVAIHDSGHHIEWIKNAITEG
ncbi:MULTISPECIES: YraN family protein [Vibrio]|uniref:UPF0102 protein F9817_01115 n=2 Tax=Vibrio TaxID=662 RepID=A0A7X4RT38_9VIBR|nr:MULTISPECIES: YraN family protein [Vibrio]MBF9001519.1 YraN family protein [Vibrio nitrifigilis]MZI91807.1 YraN family protein [Vibrio eleionomae]